MNNSRKAIDDYTTAIEVNRPVPDNDDDADFYYNRAVAYNEVKEHKQGKICFHDFRIISSFKLILI